MFSAHHRICAAAFATDFALMTGATAVPFFVRNQLGGEELLIGVMSGAGPLSYSLVCLVSSRYVARASNGLHLAAVGLVLFAAFFTAFPFFTSVPVNAALLVGAFASLALIWPALHSWVGAEPDPQSRSRHMITFNIAWSTGFATAPLVAGPLYDTYYRAPFFVIGAACACAFLAVLTLPHERAHFGAATREQLHARRGHDLRSEAFLAAAWLGTGVANALAGVTRSVFTKRVEDLLRADALTLVGSVRPPELLRDAPATLYSWLAFALCITTAACFFVLGRTSRWHHRFSWLAATQAAAAVAFVVLGYTQMLAVMFVCFIVVGMNLGMAFFSSTYYSLANAEQKHGRAAMNEFAVGLGSFLGASVFGLAGQRYGLVYPFVATPIFVAAAVLVQYGLLRAKAASLRHGD